MKPNIELGHSVAIGFIVEYGSVENILENIIVYNTAGRGNR